MKSYSIWISLLFFVLCFGIFIYGFDSMNQSQSQEDEQRVNESIKKGILECYAVEGKYPKSFAYLSKHYGIYVNEEKYMVHYEYQGANLYPSYMVYVKGEN